MIKRFLLTLPLILCPALGSSAAEENPFVEGVAYKLIVPAQPTTSEGKIEVVEIFWYGCPHCHKLQPFVERWLRNKPENVEYVRLPAVLSDNWEIHARAYYTAEAMGVLDKIHQQLFNAIHVDHRRLNTEESLRGFFAQAGVDPTGFDQVFHSFAVSTKVRRAREMTRRYQVAGTPTVVVAGKYRTGPREAEGSFDTMMQIVSFLIKKEGGTI